jgi:hypothetical protein
LPFTGCESWVRGSESYVVVAVVTRRRAYQASATVVIDEIASATNTGCRIRRQDDRGDGADGAGDEEPLGNRAGAPDSGEQHEASDADADDARDWDQQHVDRVVIHVVD